ncbi:MAG TPA: hypothetical protein VF093_09000 [Solirubrobacterales bacterium]
MKLDPVTSSRVALDGPAIDVRCQHEEHPVFDPPDDYEATIWRYLDFTKLVSLIDTQRLYFARVDTFDDSFEGSVSAATRAARREWFPDLDPEGRDERLKDLQRISESAPSWMYASCWNLSEMESAALWGLYVRSGEGVAIRSTYWRLVDSIDTRGNDVADPLAPFWAGKVAYVDYDEDLIPDENALSPFVHKRRSFEFEREVRAMTWAKSPQLREAPSPIGLRVAVDLGRLIAAIHVSPTAPAWFASLVRSVVSHYGCDAPVRQSSLSGTPLY